MTQEQLEKHRQFCKYIWNGYGEDVFQEACLIALQRYKTFDKVNQKLFGLLCKEAARKLLKHRKYEIPFSQLFSNDLSNGCPDKFSDETCYNEEIFENFENTLIDPRSEALSLDDVFFANVLDDFSDKKQLFQLPFFFFTQ